MSRFVLKSYEFRRERERGWHELEAILARADAVGVQGLEAGELHRLPVLHRAALSSLSVARAISLDRNLVAYLESLAVRSHLRVYGAKEEAWTAVQRFFQATFPALVRDMKRWLAVSLALLAAGTAAGFSLVAKNIDHYPALVPEQVAQGRGPESTREELLAVLHGGGGDAGEEGRKVDLLAAFAGFLFAHNARVGMLCFALGFAVGVPVALLLFSTGLQLGALAGLHHHRGLDAEFWAWVLPHGVTELLAVALCAAAGLALGQALLRPGRYGRLQGLAFAGRRVAPVVLGAVAMFLVAALIEGLFRQLVVGEGLRYLLALTSTVFWIGYFTRAGRGGGGAVEAPVDPEAGA